MCREPIPPGTVVGGAASPAGGQADEARLLRRMKRGDLDAFEALYKAHASRVHAICLRMSGDPAAAEELTQEAFVRAWEKRATFRGEGRFAPWLVRLTINVVLTARRSRARWEARVTATEDLSHFAAPARPGGASLDLERAISALPPGARTVFVLHDVEGYRHGEIAEMTGLAVGTCKAQLHRARKLLREVLA